MDDCLKGSNALFAGLFCLEYTGFLPSREKGGGVLLQEVLVLALGLCPSLLPAAGPGAPLLWAKALCVLQEGAHGWLVDNEAAFSGAAKLRLLRGRVGLGSLARRPRAMETAWRAWHRCLLAGTGMAASGGNHAFISFAVGHGSPVVIGSCRLVRFLLPAFLGCLTVLPVAPGAAGHSC